MWRSPRAAANMIEMAQNRTTARSEFPDQAERKEVDIGAAGRAVADLKEMLPFKAGGKALGEFHLKADAEIGDARTAVTVWRWSNPVQVGWIISRIRRCA